MAQFQHLGLETLEERLPFASDLPAGFTETLVATGIVEPNAMAFAPDGRIFVAEKRSGIRVIENGAVLPTRFVSLTVEQGGERGVQNVIFDPNFATNGYVYVYYARFSSSGSFDRLSRFTANPANPNVALPGETIILDKIPTVAPGFHNGGMMEFGADGMLYLGIGDLTFPNSVQSLTTINGKLLRLNTSAFDPTKPIDISNYNPATPNPLVPADNPYVGKPNAWPIIYATGLRNPFTGDVLPGTNTIYINDVGAGLSEEINQAAPGANYGWPLAEGPSTTPGLTNPVYQYPHVPPGSGAAIAGGSFYTGSMFPSGYSGTYFFSDYVGAFIKNFNPATGVATPFATNVFIPVDIDQAPDGSLYWLSHGPGGGAIGSIYKITYSPGANQAPTANAVATTVTAGLPPLTVGFSGTGSTDPNGDALTYTWNFGDGTFGTGATASHTYTTAGNYSVTLTVNDRPDGSGLSSISQPIAVTVGNRAPTGSITLPQPGTTYKAGDVVTFSGTGFDPDDGTLPPSALSWSIVFHHNTHTHPFIDGVVGSGGTFTIPLTGEYDADQWYRVVLTVTDSGGLQNVSSIDVAPQRSFYTINSSITGIPIGMDGQPLTFATTLLGVVGMTRELSAPLSYTIGSQTYNFVSWSDGGAATHTISIPATATTFTANYALATTLTLPAGFEHAVAVAGLYEPSTMTYLPDGRLLVAEKPYGIRVIKNGALLSTPLITLPVDAREDRGVTSVVADPNFATNGYIYVYYAHLEGPSASHNRVSRFTITPGTDVADPASELVIVNNIPIGTPGYHHGGLMRFGADGMLYVAIGELMNPTAAQDLSKYNGKLLRMNVAGYNPAVPSTLVPADNPFINTPGAIPTIWAYGLRNTFSGDMLPGTNTLLMNDAGSGWEEINLAASGANYGWPNTEGSASTDPAFTKPVYTYQTVQGSNVIAGGSFYTGTTLPTAFSGKYFFGDYLSGKIRVLDPLTGTATDFASDLYSIVNLLQGTDGSLYVLTHGPNGGAFGAIHRISYTGSTNTAPTAVAQATSPTTGDAPLTVSFSGIGSSDPENDPLVYAWDFGDGSFGSGATVSHTYAAGGSYSATLTVRDRATGGLASTATPISVTVANSAPLGTITAPINGAFYTAGTTISFAGTAADAEDGTLPASAYQWTIDLYHDAHSHSFQTVSGVTGGSFQIPLAGELDPDQRYRITLTVTDSGGRTHTSFVEVLPQLSAFELTTNIAGLSLSLDGEAQTLPVLVQGVVGAQRTISAPLQQSVAGQIYQFVSWSDGGAATHTIATPAIETTFTATYALVTTNVAPVANAESVTTTLNTPVTISALANDTDSNNDTLAITGITQATSGTVVLNANQTITYTPNFNFRGRDSFSYTISDGQGGTATGFVSVAVRGVYYLSTSTAGTLTGNVGGSVSFATSDILQLAIEPAGEYQYQLYFDGSDVGLTTTSESIDAFDLLPDGSIVLSTTGSFSVPGGGGTITGSGEDLLRFVPSSVGPETAGTWSMYFDGSDVGLSGSSENIDAVAVLTSGQLLISVNGNFSVPGGVSGQDEDLIAFSPTALGATTAGGWSMYFDGSDVSLSTSPNENVTGLYVAENGTSPPKLYLSTVANFTVPGLSGQNEDIFAFTPTSLGANTAGSYGPGLSLDGSSFGLTNFTLTGFQLGLASTTPTAVAVATSPTSGVAPLTVNFSGTGSIDPSGGGLTYTWNFGDGQTATGALVSHTYTTFGNYSATLTVTAGSNSHTSPAIAISATQFANNPPIANPDTVTTTQNTPLVVNVLGNDTDPENNLLNVTGVTQPAHGSVVVNPDKTVTYTPSASYLGPDTFTYSISDGLGGTAQGTVNVSVRGKYLLSTTTSGTIAGSSGGSVSFSEADILQLILEATDQYSYEMFFDGSDVGLSTADENIDAFAILPDGSLVISTLGAFSVPGASGAINGGGEDLLRFVPTSFGDATAGTWSLYFDGSDVSLSGTAENIDAVAVLANGDLLLSFAGNFSVSGGVSGQDEDLARFVPSSLGAATAGAWSMYFDGSDVSLSTSPSENLVGLDVRESTTGGNPSLYLAFFGGFSVPGQTGQNEDIIEFTPTSLGSNTTGDYGPGLTLDGSLYGLTSFALDGLHLGAAPTVGLAQSQSLPLPAQESQSAAIWSASYITTAPATMTARSSVTYTMTVTNTGNQTWLAGGSDRVRLGVYFDGNSDAIGDWSSEPPRYNLPRNLAPGESATIVVTLTAPSRGSYTLRQRLVQGSDNWFEDLTKKSVTVRR